jgi:hypothetical protein
MAIRIEIPQYSDMELKLFTHWMSDPQESDWLDFLRRLLPDAIEIQYCFDRSFQRCTEIEFSTKADKKQFIKEWS